VVQTVSSSMLLCSIVFRFTALAAHHLNHSRLLVQVCSKIFMNPIRVSNFQQTFKLSIYTVSVSCHTMCFMHYTTQMANTEIRKPLINMSCSGLEVRSLSDGHKWWSFTFWQSGAEQQDIGRGGLKLDYEQIAQQAFVILEACKIMIRVEIPLIKHKLSES